MLMNGAMNPLDLTVSQLRRAAAIKEQIENLNKELRGILGAPANTRAAPKKKRTMSTATKKQDGRTVDELNQQRNQSNPLRRPRRKHLVRRPERSCQPS